MERTLHPRLELTRRSEIDRMMIVVISERTFAVLGGLPHVPYLTAPHISHGGGRSESLHDSTCCEATWPMKTERMMIESMARKEREGGKSDKRKHKERGDFWDLWLEASSLYIRGGRKSH